MAVTGYAALSLALAASLYAAFAYFTGTKTRRPRLTGTAKISLLAAGGLLTLAVAVLLAALLAHDFQISYVASYSSRGTPLGYVVSALWAGNDGSLLFWAWLLSIFAAVMVFHRRESSQGLLPYAAGVMMVVQFFFLIVLLAVANPFRTVAVPPADGVGLNPMLQNPGMVLHPPALLAGYVALTVPFAFAIAALLVERPGGDWLEAARGWALLAWLLLGVGNIIGAWWAYVELGWGGYWAWDPVENAGMMPWLAVTAFLHSGMGQRRRGMFKVWTMVLIMLAFSLSIFGTYINRSGVLSSVHTYGESSMGPYFLIFLIVIVVGSLGLLYYRRDGLRSDADVEAFVSRESALLVNNILLTGLTAIVFFGTVFPAISQTVSAAPIEVGRAFFDTVSGPIFLAIILLAGVCTLVGWRPTPALNLLRRLVWPAVAAAAVSILLFILGVREGYAVVGGFICGLVFFAILSRWLREAREARLEGQNFASAGWGLFLKERPRYGGLLVHLAIVIIAVGVIGSSIFDVSKEVSLGQGEATTLKGYTLVYTKLNGEQALDEQVVSATVDVYRGEKHVVTLAPQKIFHRSFDQPVTNVAIHTTALEDLYVILAGWDQNGIASFVILVNPLMVWLWVGGGVFLLGGIVALWPQHRIISTLDTAIEDEIEKQVREMREGARRID